MKRPYLIFVLLLFSLSLFPGKPDSLKMVVDQAKNDTASVLRIIKQAQKICGNYPDDALTAVKKAGEIASKINYTYGTARVYMLTGLCCKNKALFDTAQSYYAQAIEILTKLNKVKDISTTYNNMGVVEKERGAFAKSLDYYVKALNLLDEKTDAKALGRTYSNIGIIYRNMKNFDKALDYQMKALKYDSLAKDKNATGRGYANIGNIYLETKKNELAILYFKESLRIFSETDDKQSSAIILNNLSEAYSIIEDYKNAILYARQALELSEKLDDIFSKSHIYQLLGEINLKQGYYNVAEKNMLEALRLFVKMGNPNKIKDIYRDLADLYRKKKQPDKAIVYFEKYSTIKDSLFNGDLSRQITEMEQKYQSAQKQKEIELLTQNESIKDLQIKKKNTTIYAGLLIGVVLIIFLFMIYRNLQEKKKTNHLLGKQNQEITDQKMIIEEKNKDIIDSLNYAQRLQENILPPDSTFKELLPGSFVFYKPKDIVSGDFYWIESHEENIYIAVVDCTGHGVPGAFMSIVGNNLLHKILKEEKVSSCAKILDRMVISLVQYLRQDGSNEKISNDGMDISLCRINCKTREAQYAGAFNPLLIVQNGILTDYKADKFSIGRHTYTAGNKFTETNIQLQPGSILYLFSDGYADQFGGVKGKKFMRKNFYALLKEIAHTSPEEQKQKLEQVFYDWKKENVQVDDVCVLGIRV